MTKLLLLGHTSSVSERWTCARYFVSRVWQEWGLRSFTWRVRPYPQYWLGQTSCCMVQCICEAYPVSYYCVFSETILEWTLCTYNFLFDVCYRLDSHLPTAQRETLQPHCCMSVNPSPVITDHIPAIRLRYRLHLSPDPRAAQWLGVLAGDENSSTEELGTRIALALQEVQYMKYYCGESFEKRGF